MSDTKTVTLTDFLLARIAEDERTDMCLHHSTGCRQFGGWPGDPASAVDCDCGLSARVLAECEAKRRIVERCASVDFAMPSTHLAHGILADLALPYAAHPDYRDEWRP